jgi:hypothetical protein
METVLIFFYDLADVFITAAITMSRKMYLVLGVGLILGFGLALSARAGDTDLARPGFPLTTLDGSGNAGQDTSVTIGADGLGLISYHDVTNGNLKVAHCPDLFCVPDRRR